MTPSQLKLLGLISLFKEAKVLKQVAVLDDKLYDGANLDEEVVFTLCKAFKKFINKEATVAELTYAVKTYGNA